MAEAMEVYPVGVQIKSDHWAAFRSGQWGTIRGYKLVQRLCYEIEWPGSDELPATDLWPVEDPVANYQFRASDG